MAADWLTGLLAFLGGGVGAALAYAASLRGDRQREGAARREEWGRRFTAALTDVGDDSERRRRLGRVLLEQLVSSELASPEERALARVVLTQAATTGPDGHDLAGVLGLELRDLVVEGIRGGGVGDAGGSGAVGGGVTVTAEQVEAAQAVLRMGAADGDVPPLVRAIAAARPAG